MDWALLLGSGISWIVPSGLMIRFMCFGSVALAGSDVLLLLVVVLLLLAALFVVLVAADPGSTLQ